MFSNFEKTEALVLVVMTLVIIVEILFLITGIASLDEGIQTEADRTHDASFVTQIAQSIIASFNTTSTPAQTVSKPKMKETQDASPESLSYKNCGIIQNSKSDDEIQTIADCFDQRFTACLPGRVQFDLTVQGQSLSYFFEIEGAQKGRCVVDQGYVEHPSVRLEETMTCRYPGSAESLLQENESDDVQFLSGSQGLNELNENQCSGPLYEELRMLLIASQSENPDCSLNASVLQIRLPVGTGFSVSASGFKGSPDEVLWAPEDPSIVDISSSSGETVQVIKNASGDTRVLVVDSSISGCQIAIDVFGT